MGREASIHFNLPGMAVRGPGSLGHWKLSWDQASRLPRQANHTGVGPCFPRAHSLVEKHTKQLPYK